MGKKGKYNNQRDEQENTKKKGVVITQHHLMDKTHMETTEYLPFLPVDSIYPPFNIPQEQVLVLRQILKDLNFTLYLQFKNFWATILYNPSFKICIHSCIQFFHRSWLNEYHKFDEDQKSSSKKDEYYQKIKDTEYFQYTQALMKIVLLIYFRIVHFEQQNIQLSNIYNIKTQIIIKYILDIPRLIEIIEIYGQTNEDIVRVIVKQFINLSPTLYTHFTTEIIQPMILRMNKNVNFVKKTTDREQFGIQYSYKRNIQGVLSPGQEQLSKKIKLLMEILCFYQTLSNIRKFFPTAWAQYTKFNVQIHNISENVFIELEQAYKVWNNHEQGEKIYALINQILKLIINYFLQFVQKCDRMFVKKSEKSSFKQAYLNCLQRMFQNYGKRNSLGKKASGVKRYMDLYRQIMKKFNLDEFTSQLYRQIFEQKTYDLNLQYLTDFKIAIDEQQAKMKGRKMVQVYEQNQRDREQQQKTEADKTEHKQEIEIEEKEKQKIEDTPKPIEKEPELDNLEILIAKKDREEDYYYKLYKNYRTKIQIEYDDQYDDLVDYEKRPMFEDNYKEEQDSSDEGDMEENNGQSGFKGRRRGNGYQQNHEKYNRKDKVKFVPVKQAETRAILNRQANKQTNRQTQNTQNNQKQRANYSAKQQQPQQKPSKTCKNEYNDEQCYQQLKEKHKQQKKDREQFNQKQSKEQKKYENKSRNLNDEDSDDDRNNRNRGGRGGRGGKGGNTNNNYNKTKGQNTNKKPKYIAKQ